MQIEKTPRGGITLYDARLIFENFSGRETDFNEEGNRNFAIIIPEDCVETLQEDGWNVKIKVPNNPDIDPYHYLNVKVSYRGRRDPIVKLISGGNMIDLTENTIGRLDNADLVTVDVSLNPYDWTKCNNSGRAAYLNELYATLNVSALERRYAEMESPEE